MTRAEVIDWLTTLQAEYDPSAHIGSDEDFRQVANGFWQDTGNIGGYLNRLHFKVVCGATQLFSEESVKFFLRLDAALGYKGSFNIYLTKGTFRIYYSITGWASFLNEFAPYFNMLYGLRRSAITKLKIIHKLKDLRYVSHKDKDYVAITYLFSLVYSLYPHTNRGRITLEDKLRKWEIDPALLEQIPEVTYPENKK